MRINPLNDLIHDGDEAEYYNYTASENEREGNDPEIAKEQHPDQDENIDLNDNIFLFLD